MAQLVSIKEIARRFSVSPTTVRRLIEIGAIPTVRVGRSIRIEEDAAAAFVARHRGQK